MIEGQFFKPDGMSRNGRWYPKSLWEKALTRADVVNRFNTSTMSALFFKAEAISPIVFKQQ